MADELVEAPSESQEYSTLSLDEKQRLYDSAAWEYIDYLSWMDAKQAAAHFKRLEWIENWQPDAATHCPMCGDAVIELKWDKNHTQWQCLEPTCRESWYYPPDWRAR